jgi:hypothetical protein
LDREAPVLDDLAATVRQFDAGDAMRPGEYIRAFQGLDCLVDGVPVASGLVGYGLVAGEAFAGFDVAESPEPRLQHVEGRV